MQVTETTQYPFSKLPRFYPWMLLLNSQNSNSCITLYIISYPSHSERCGRTMLIEILIVSSAMQMILLCRPTTLLLSRDSHCLNSQDPGMKKKKIAKAFNRHIFIASNSKPSS